MLQRVEVRYTPTMSQPIIVTDSVFAESSAGIDRDILAQSAITGEFRSTAAAGRFGQVGMQVAVLSGLPGGGVYGAEILVGSDEYVNTFGVAADVRTQFIVDGGRLQDLFSRQGRVTFELQVGAENRGMAPAEDSEPFMESSSRFAADFGANGLFPGGGYTATLATGATGDRSFTHSFTGGLDLGAQFDGVMTVDIPLSLQTVALGALAPGERLLVGYRAAITIEQNGPVEGLLGEYADPFQLDGEPNPILALSGVTITPVPEPATWALWLAALSVLALRRLRAEVRSTLA